MSFESIAVLLLEDDDRDAELIRERLLAGGLTVAVRRAKMRAEYEAELRSTVFDVILSVFSLPGYDGLAAL